MTEGRAGVICPRGVDIAWREDGEGPPLLMLHGVGSSMESFDALAAHLAPGFRLIRYDLRGHGASAH